MEISCCVEKRWRTRRSAIRPHLPGHQPNVEVNGSTARGRRGRRVTANSQTLRIESEFDDLHVEEIHERRFLLFVCVETAHTAAEQDLKQHLHTHTEHTPLTAHRLFMRLYPLQVSLSLVWTCETCNRSTQNELTDASTPHEKTLTETPERSFKCSLTPAHPASLSESLRSMVYTSGWKKARILIQFLKRKRKI